MTRLLISLGLLITASAALAAGGAPQDSWYDVELVVFEYKGPPGDGSEIWSDDPGTPDFEGAIEPVAQPAASEGAAATPAQRKKAAAAAAWVPFQALDPASFRLTALEGRLARSSAYVPLAHLGWRQPVNTGSAQAIRVHGSRPGDNGVSIDGTVRLSRGRFVAATLDLIFHKPTASSDWTALGVLDRNARQADTFRLQQAKRIRGGELNYFDHPRFGAVLLLTPLDAQAKKDLSAPETPEATDD